MWNISFYYYAINTFYQIIQVLKRITEDNLVYATLIFFIFFWSKCNSYINTQKPIFKFTITTHRNKHFHS